RVPIAPPRTVAARAPRQEGLGCGVFLVGMLVLAGVLGLVYFVSTGALGSLFASVGRGGNDDVIPPFQPTATVEAGEPTPTAMPGVAVPDLTGFTDTAADAALRQLQLVPVRLARNDPL